MTSEQRHDLAKLTAGVLVVAASIMAAPVAAIAAMIGFMAGRELAPLPDPTQPADEDEEE